MSPFRPKPFLAAPAVAAGTFAAAVGLYMLALLCGAAAARRRPQPDAPEGSTHFVVVVPAHDEEPVIAAAVASAKALDHPADRFEIVVVADNCSDDTAAVARAAGATVWERSDPAQPGKGRALSWAFERIAAERPDADAVVVIDADCAPSANLLRAFDSRFRAGAHAVQSDYVVANPGESEAAALRYAGFTLVNTVRPLGKSQLGLSAGLLGTGMGFTTELLGRVPWQSYGLTEDLEQHLRLVAAGESVQFVPEARVTSAMPSDVDASRAQQERWEAGKWECAREWTPRLLADGLERRDANRIHAALEPLVPAQSLLLVGATAALLAPGPFGARAARRLGAFALAAQAGFVLGGLRLAGAPPEVYAALRGVPRLAAMKLGMTSRVMSGRGPREWVRTERA